jgi:hypothetical protein
LATETLKKNKKYCQRAIIGVLFCGAKNSKQTGKNAVQLNLTVIQIVVCAT